MVLMGTRICSVPDCERAHSAKGYCSPHYYQARRGKVPGPLRIIGDDAARFWQKVDRGDHAECWPWRAGSDGRGYGHFYYQGRVQKAPRVAWALTHGPIPKGMEVCHACDHPPCVNPGHLFLGTHAENLADMHRKGRGRGNPTPPPSGEQHTAAKMTWAKVSEARARHAEGASLGTLARDYGVTPPTMWAIVHRRTWKRPPTGTVA